MKNASIDLLASDKKAPLRRATKGVSKAIGVFDVFNQMEDSSCRQEKGVRMPSKSHTSSKPSITCSSLDQICESKMSGDSNVRKDSSLDQICESKMSGNNVREDSS